MSGNDQYDVGYSKPPENGMFKKGQSGNPKGRPKGARNFRSEIEDILNSPVTISDAGRKKSVRTLRAALMRLKEKALKGDQRALEQLLGYAQDVFVVSDARFHEQHLSRLESEILERFSQVVRGDSEGGPGDE